jgi:hypothetical protein
VEATSLARVANKPGHPGERDISVKTTARGMPGATGVTVVTTLVCSFYFACEAAGASRARHSLRPLFCGGPNAEAKLARNTRRDREAVFEFDVVARSEATKQSISLKKDGLPGQARQ